MQVNTNGNGSQSLEEAKEHLRKAKDKGADALNEFSEQVADSARQTKDQMKEKVEVYSDQMTQYIQDSPLKAVGIAAAVGALLALILKP